MQPMNLTEIIEAVKGRLLWGESGSRLAGETGSNARAERASGAGAADFTIFGISTDSRKIEPGFLYIPIIGERFDGHDFIAQAFENGAAVVLTDRAVDPIEGKAAILVKDTTHALGDLAAFHRSKFKIPLVAVTGSVGKTSTKDMIASVLSQQFKVLKTAGNFNNNIGLPLTLLGLEPYHDVAVIEMGMSGLGEIARLSEIAKPDIAVITNIGVSHIEQLGTKENILKAKLEILEHLSDDGAIILNGDDDLLAGLKGRFKNKTILFGIENDVDCRACDIVKLGAQGTSFRIKIAQGSAALGRAVQGGKLSETDSYSAKTGVPGVHNVYNALAAVAVGRELGIPMELIIEGIYRYEPGDMRLNILHFDGIDIIDDTYNASPQSNEAALEVLEEMPSKGRKYAVLGDMLEMGGYSKQAHEEVGQSVANHGVDFLITVGVEALNIARAAIESGFDENSVKTFEDTSDAANFLKATLKSGDVALIKGSRGMKMEYIVSELIKNKKEV